MTKAGNPIHDYPGFYDVGYPLICPKCGSEMAVLTIITNPEEVHKILNHLRKNKSPPFDNKSHPEVS